VLSAGAGSETIFARPSSFRPAVVGPRPGGVADVHIRYNGTTRTLDMLARPMGVSEGPSAAIDAFIAAIGPSYCERWGRQLAGGRLVDGPMDASDLLALGAGILRDQADAEIALVNTGVVDSSFSRGAGEVLTASDVFLSLLYDEPLMRASVSAQWLTTLARSMDPSRLLALGLEISGPNTSGEKIKVNGRPIEARGSYTVTTLRFLAAGGDGLLPEGVRWEPTGLTLRGAVLDHLGQAREIDPRASLSNPADRLEWTLREDLSATFTGTVIRNAAGYGATQLTNSETTNFGIESTLGWAGVSRLFAWENTVLARFGLTSTAGSDFEEGTDLLSYRTTARWRGLRDARAEIYVPDPFLEGYVESELTRPDERDYHHLLLRPTLGLQFTITRHLSFRGSAGFELNALDPEAELLPGLGAVLELKSWRVMSEGQSRLETAFLLDYFVAGVGDLNRQTLRGRLEASINLTTVLSLSLLVDVFGMRERDAPFAFGTSTTAALKLSWLGRRLGG
ncbi:MAG: 5'-nucleotidase C-terminal domain-containing protein, partial [Myxococcales bacterium]|nr:5'-nucleotidase C-terminal domain-containing protein [Myxococcales bacterium]